jgi:GDP-4-dehydro-6-deoxy-D-mannose reductase
MSQPNRKLSILITGATGCAGSHLSELALSRGAHVHGFALSGNFVRGSSGRLGDIRYQAAIDAAVAETEPDWVFHLAALIPGAKPDASGPDFFRTNVVGTYLLLDAVRRLASKARVLVAISSAVYGQPSDHNQAITEDFPLHAQSMYAAVKTGQDLLAAQFYAEHGLHTIRGRTFNQTGPREPATLVCATLAREIALIEARRQNPVLRAMTFATSRDFTDVRDVVEGYWAAVECGSAGQAYNICSGRLRSIRQIAEILVGFSTVRGIQLEEVGPPPGPGAILEQTGDASRLHACSGWRPRIPLERSLRDLLDEWRRRVRAETGQS